MTENNNPNITDKIQNIKTICEQCQFMQSCKLSQQIVELREKLIFYENKNKKIQQFIDMSWQQQHEILNQYENSLSDQIGKINEQQQVLQLEKQLEELEKQLQAQKLLQLDGQIHEAKLCKKFAALQDSQFHSSKEYIKLLEQLNQLKWKQNKLQSLKLLLQRTNFINIIYSINFEDGDSFLNGEKITPQNSWKIIEILAFYQQKYPSYEPIVKINWNEMQIIPNILKIQEASYFDSIISNPIQICCDSASNVLNTWMQYVVQEMKTLFQFLVKQSGLHAKLKYEVSNDRQFEIIKNRTFKSQTQKFNLIVKYLLIDIDQINKLEFFAKEKRIKQAQQKE